MTATVTFNLMRIAQMRFCIRGMRRSGLHTALELHVLEIPATAGETFGQWSLESQGEGKFASAFKRTITTQNVVGPGLAFICNHESKYVVAYSHRVLEHSKMSKSRFPLRY